MSQPAKPSQHAAGSPAVPCRPDNATAGKATRAGSGAAKRTSVLDLTLVGAPAGPKAELDTDTGPAPPLGGGAVTPIHGGIRQRGHT
jgi:hypothetical protein